MPLVLVVLVLGSGAQGPAMAQSPQLFLADGCASEAGRIAHLPIILLGEADWRPSVVRTAVFFDPVQLQPVTTAGRPAVVRGPFVPSNAHFTWNLDLGAGRIDLVVRTQGRSPLPPLPSGILATIRFRVLATGQGDEPIRLDLDPGTESRDGEERIMSTVTMGPAYIWTGPSPLQVSVEDESGVARVRVDGQILRGDHPWLLRGRTGDLQKLGAGVSLGEMLPVAADGDGREAVDDLQPVEGDAFFYVAAQPDGMGRPFLGFSSDCRPRVIETGKAETGKADR